MIEDRYTPTASGGDFIKDLGPRFFRVIGNAGVGGDGARGRAIVAAFGQQFQGRAGNQVMVKHPGARASGAAASGWCRRCKASRTSTSRR